MDNKIQVLGYDFEVFVNIKWWCVTFITAEYSKDSLGNVHYEILDKSVIINDSKLIKQFYNKNQDMIFVGFNSRGYDQWILKGLLGNLDIFKITNALIFEYKRGYECLPPTIISKYPINNYDVGTLQNSLKQLEGFMGSDIRESAVDFNINRPMSESEVQSVLGYNEHDVLETLKVLKYKFGDFEAHVLLIDMFNLPKKMFNKTKVQMTSDILGAKRQLTLDDEFEIIIPSNLKIEKYKHIVDWYLNPKNMTYKKHFHSTDKNHNNSLKVQVAGIDHILGWGGIHGAIGKYYAEGILLYMDVTALYPMLKIIYEFKSRKLTDTMSYNNIVNKRVELKAKKDSRQIPMKIPINGAYGGMKDKNNNLYDPLMANQVCVHGQLFILDLIEKIEDYGIMFQDNTDGIFISVSDMETVNKIKSIAKEWENRTKLNLEWDIFKKIYQKDVNNYIAIYEDGTFKSKGAYVKELSPVDNDLPIINKSLINYFTKNIPIEKTINDCNDLMEFQKIVKLSVKYNDFIYGNSVSEKQNDGSYKMIIKNGQLLREKVHRIFASTNETACGIYKIKKVGLDSTFEKIANTPKKCFFHNESVIGVKVPNELDKQYYIDLAENRLNQFLNPDEEKVDLTPQELFKTMRKSNTFYEFLVALKKDNVINCNTVAFKKYIKANCFKNYAYSKKIFLFNDYFNLIYDKVRLNKSQIEKISKVNVDLYEPVNSILFELSEQTISGKTYTINYDIVLKEIWKLIKNEHLPIEEIILNQIEMFNEVRIIDKSFSNNIYCVLNIRNEIAPNNILYKISDGSYHYRKINRKSFDILPLYDRDIIEIQSSEILYGLKFAGKDKKGINEYEIDSDKPHDVIMSYNILYRDYTKSKINNDYYL